MAFGDQADVDYASHARQRVEKITLMPYAAVAALLARRQLDAGAAAGTSAGVVASTGADGEWELAPRVAGRAYATLPLPITTGLNVHLNGRWEIASDRNSLAADDALPRHEWNVRLGCRVCAAAYARLLREVAHGFPAALRLTSAQRGEIVHTLLPPSGLPGVFGGVASGTMALLLNASSPVWTVFAKHGCSSAAQRDGCRVLHTTADTWATPQEALYLNGGEGAGGAAGGGAAGGGAAGDVGGDAVLTLTRAGCLITHAPQAAFEGFDAAAKAQNLPPPCALSPATVRAWLREPDGGEKLIIYLGGLDATARRDACRILLALVLSDQPRTAAGSTYNPPEETRSYSSVWKKEALGTGHARSCLDSPQAWSAQHNNDQQWLCLQCAAGGEEACVQGLVLQGRRKHNQHVTDVAIHFSPDGKVWVPVPGGPFATGCKPNDETHHSISFERPVVARYVRVSVLSFAHHVSMRCGLTLGVTGAAIAGLPLVAMQDGSVCAVARASSSPSASESTVLLDLESDPSSSQLVASRGVALLGRTGAVRFAEDDAQSNCSCARLLWPVRQGLLVSAFSPADAVEAVLPSAWKGQPSVRWRSEEQQPSPDWLSMLWAAIDRTALFGGATADEMRERLRDWPIVPCGDELVQLSRAPAVLFAAGGKGKGKEGRGQGGDGRGLGQEWAAFSGLRSLGVAIADQTFDLKAIAFELAPLTGSGILAALGRLTSELSRGASLNWDAVSADQRAAILDVISRDVRSLGDDQLTQLGALPLFPFEDAADALAPSGCGSLGPVARRWTKPEFKSLTASDGAAAEFTSADGAVSRFLSRIPPSAPRAVLYSALNIVPMNRSDFYVNVVFGAGWRDLSQSAQLSQVTELQRHYENIKEDNVTLPDGSSQTSFGDFFTSAPIFRSLVAESSLSTTWLKVSELLDPQIELHNTFFPERLPHPSLCQEACLQWLRRCGMYQSLTRSAFIAAARKVDAEATRAIKTMRPPSADVRAQAQQVVSALCSGFSSLSDDTQQPDQPPLDEWLRELGTLRIASPFALPPRAFEKVDPSKLHGLGEAQKELLQLCRATGYVEPLVPFAGTVIPLETSHIHLLNSACWSCATVVQVPNARQLPQALVLGLGAYTSATLQHLVQHTIFLCSQPPPMLMEWQRDSRDVWIEGRSKVGRSGTFTQQLELGCYAFLATADPMELQAALGDAPIVLLDSTYRESFQFIRPSSLFVDLSYSAPPYAFTLRDTEMAFGRVRLHALLDCPRTPSLDQLVGWVQDMQQHAGERPLPPLQLRAATVLADLAAIKLYYASFDAAAPRPQPFLIPDRTLRLRRAPDLLVDDAPWLDGRVDNGHLPLVHASLNTTTALRLGARALSTAVLEVPDGPLLPLSAEAIDGLLYPGAHDAVSSQLGTWNKNLRSRGFRVAVRRAADTTRKGSLAYRSSLARQASSGQMAEGREAQSASDAEARSRIDELRHASIVCVGEIRSKFLVQSNQEWLDVTRRGGGGGTRSAGGGRNAGAGSGRDGSYGSDAMTVLDDASGVPTIYVKLGQGNCGGEHASGRGVPNGAAPPALGRQVSGYRLMQKTVKRWKPCLATELDRYLGEGTVRDRMLLVELLDVDLDVEMPDVLNLCTPAAYTVLNPCSPCSHCALHTSSFVC